MGYLEEKVMERNQIGSETDTDRVEGANGKDSEEVEENTEVWEGLDQYGKVCGSEKEAGERLKDKDNGSQREGKETREKDGNGNNEGRDSEEVEEGLDQHGKVCGSEKEAGE